MLDQELLDWFNQHAKPFLELNAGGRLAPLISDARRLEQIMGEPPDAVVCCLGGAGVGKSTLINALVTGDYQLLPAGGTGPLTALATKVCYGEQRRFRVRYHRPNLLWQVILPITGFVARGIATAERAGEGAHPPAIDPADAASAELTADELAVASRDAEAEEGDGQGRLREFIKMARKLVTGEQFDQTPEAYIVDCLRIALDQPAKFGHAPRAEHLGNLERIRNAVRMARRDEVYERSEGDDLRGFKLDLDHHAAGNLAPLISSIDVEWPAELLREGISIVDLPGVGVAGDMYRDTTQSYVRDKARAVLLVVDRAGMGEVAHNMLRTSGYWDRLVGAAYEPDADPCALIIAVSKVDEVVLEEFAATPKPRPPKTEMLARTVAKMRENIRRQTALQLHSLEASTSEDLNTARSLASANLLATLQVHPVVAPDYRRIIAEDEEDPPHVARELDQTEIPRLEASLRQLARELRERHDAARETVRARFVRGVRGELEIIEAQWRDDQRIAEEVERLRLDLDTVVRPWREQLANRQGGFREFLQAAVPEKIEALIIEAREAAEADVRRYLKSLRDYHWATLRAAVRKGGTWAGSRKIDLPYDISDRFQEPMAGVWGVRLLKDIRSRTGTYAKDCSEFVSKVCSWARDQGSRVNPSILERQEARIKDKADQVRAVGREATDELRTVVRSEVSKAILAPIRRRCEKFVADGDDIGPGVKQRILDMFDELALESTKAAAAPARRILQQRFVEVRDQIDEEFQGWHDPIQETVDAIVSSNEQRLRRSDSKRRSAVLGELDQIKRAMPEGADAAQQPPAATGASTQAVMA